MAKNNQTFNASIRLNTTQFKKGINEVQKGLKSLQSAFLSVTAALGLGLSFGRLGSSLLDTATKLSTAKNVLENVSKGFGEYGQNLEWLRRISNEYGQDMITLINSFAQFRAAASSSNLTLEQMRSIYESLTRAAGAFHLSADRTNDMMMAVTQMLSKGKVAAEELRRQLGNVLPGAFNLMAQAAYNAGIITENSTAALEDAMKKGKVMSEQVLPAFAKVLNDVTENANFESLQSSINRLKNSWTSLVESADFEGLYKGIVDEANKVLNWLSASFWPKVLSIGAGFAGAMAIPSVFKKASAAVKTETSAMIKEYQNLSKAHAASYKKIRETEEQYAEFSKKIRPRGATANGNYRFFTSENMPKSMEGLTDANASSLAKAAAQAKRYNEELLKMNSLRTKLYGKEFAILSKSEVKQIQRANKDFGAYLTSLKSAAPATKALAGATRVLASAWNAVAAAVKAALASIAIGAIISGITYLVSKLVEARKEAKRIAGIADEMENAVKSAGGEGNKTLVQLTNIQRAWERVGKSTAEANSGQKAALINEINKALGRTGDQLFTLESSYEDVSKAVGDYITQLKHAARQQAILSLVGEKTAKVIQLEAENAALTQDENYGKTQTYNTWGGSSTIGGQQMSVTTGLTREAVKLKNKVDANNKEIAALNEGIDRIIKMADENTLKALYGGQETVTSGTTSGTTIPDGGAKKDTPQAALNKYKEELKKLDNQYKAGAILAEDYKKKVEELNQKTFEELSSFGWDESVRALATGADKALAEELKKSATAKLLEGLDDPEAIAEFDQAMQEEADKALKKFQEAWDKFLEYRKKKPMIGNVDTSDSYMYSRKRDKSQTYSEYEAHYNKEFLSVYEKYADDLESYKQDLQNAMKDITDPAQLQRFNELLQETIDKLDLAKLVVKDLKTKANIAELEKDIADLKKEGLENVFNSVTSIADGMDRLYRAVQSLQQINDKTWPSEALENFLTGLNAIIQAFEVMKSIVEALNAVTTAYAKIKEKESAKAIALNAAEAASESAKATAAAGAAAAGAASSTASIPIIGPMLAVAAVAAVTAAILAGMKKFATGGFVGGNSYTGDKELVRVNSGELILNPTQQRNLLNLANGKAGAGGGQVDFRIRGTDLIGVMENEMRRRKG